MPVNLEQFSSIGQMTELQRKLALKNSAARTMELGGAARKPGVGPAV
jgi:hypothetical protein